MKIAKLRDNPSKAEEIQHLREFAATIPAGSYLISLFSKELVTHFEQHVSNDTSPDIMAEMAGTFQDKIDSGAREQEARQRLQRELVEKNGEIAHLQREFETITNTISQQQKTHAEQIQHIGQTSETWREKYDNAERELSAALAHCSDKEKTIKTMLEAFRQIEIDDLTEEAKANERTYAQQSATY